MMAQYVRLYRTFCAYANFVLIGHRNYLSMLCLNTKRPECQGTETKWKHKRLPDRVRAIFRHSTENKIASSPDLATSNETSVSKGFGVLYGSNKI
jgi:hypothetical protein